VDNDDPERQLVEIVLILKPLVGGHQNVAPALGVSDQLGVRERTPLSFRNGQNFMIGESLT